jgi:hypothetical protein
VMWYTSPSAFSSTDSGAGAFTSGPQNQPSSRKATIATANAGTDVHTWRLMCWWTSTPTICEARTVVSDSGDVLSPR